jgi:lipocalin
MYFYTKPLKGQAMIKVIIIISLIICILLLFINCGVPQDKKTDNIPAVKELDLNKYTGTWYEIARLPNSFEKGLDNVTATYTILENGRIEVLNQGYKSGKKKTAKGRAWLPDKTKPAELKVAFFLFFGASYKVIVLEENYEYAMVTSNSKDYLWILCRKPVMKADVYDGLLKTARDFGFNTSVLIKVKHDKAR